MPGLGMIWSYLSSPIATVAWTGTTLFCLCLRSKIRKHSKQKQRSNNCAHLTGPVMMPLRFDCALLWDVQKTNRMVICVTNLAFVSPCGGNYKVCSKFVFVMCKCTQGTEQRFQHVLCSEHLLRQC
jgi:hypothetical protein